VGGVEGISLPISSLVASKIDTALNSGKSSIILLLLRLLDPHSSCSRNIFIDDTPIHKITRSALRQRIIAIPQDPVFLPDGSSFISNLDPFGVSIESECQAVLEVVGLWTLVYQRGGLAHCFSANTLSQGQKQLFNLARAILRSRVRARKNGIASGAMRSERSCGGILLLDEVSSSMDQETDRAMQRVIHKEFKDYTVIMVCHRLEVVMDFDIIIVMDKGSVVETGPPKLLIENDGGWFHQLWSIGNEAQDGN
jgi:ATP-binding cassette subfamily C (CFTR/MRP) protein 1